MGLHRRAALLAGLCAAGGLLLLLTASLFPAPAGSPAPSPAPVEETAPPDTEPPVIEGAHDLTAAVGMTLSYRSGVTAVDLVDGTVPLQIDASAVDLTQPGEYPVVYRARDKAGNQAEITVTAIVAEAPAVDDLDPDQETDTPPEPPLPEITRELVDAEADRILARITSPSMSDYDKARAIYNYVHTHIKYVGTSDKSSWLVGAYVGFVRGRGDCYNYFACSKSLLTRAGISNVDLYRVGGSSRHYWQLVNVGSGWYHFDACPHPNSYPLDSFLIDEAAARAYTATVSPIRANYYVYDYASCPVTVAGTPTEEPLPQESLPPEGEVPVETPGENTEILPEPPAETQEPEILLPPEVTVSDPPAEEVPSPKPSAEPSPEATPAFQPEATPTQEPVPEELPSPDPLYEPGKEDLS